MGEFCGDSASITSQSLDLMISTLQSSGADKFDPVRFNFIRAMARRAREQSGAVKDKVNEAAGRALFNYQASFAQAQEDAGRLLQEKNTETAGELKALYKAGKYKEMKRLQERSRPIEKGHSLSALTDYISTLEPIAKERAHLGTFDDLLRQQEKRLLQEVGDECGAGTGASSASHVASASTPSESASASTPRP